MKFFRSLQAYISEVQSLRGSLPDIISTLDCNGKLEIYERTVAKHSLSFAYRKNFTYGQTISTAVQELRDSNGLEYTTEKWFGQLPCTGTVLQQFNWTYFSGLLVVVGLALLVGICINVIEHVYVKLFKICKDDLSKNG